MYKVNPKAVFAHRRVFDNPLAVARMERMCDAIGVNPKDVPRVELGDFDDILKACESFETQTTDKIIKLGHGRFRSGHLRVKSAPVFVFNTFAWDKTDHTPVPETVKSPQAKSLFRLLDGVGEDYAWSRRDKHVGETAAGQVCQGGWGIHTLRGCLHKCDYCSQSFVNTILLDIEDFCEHLSAMFERRPEQLLYRYDLYSDILGLEPEYGASEVLAKCFKDHGKYLLLYTRSDNVEWLADMPHRENTLLNWTLSMDTQCRTIERDSPPLANRIEAMRFCQEHGYPVRAGFSPIIPVKNWRRETTEMLEQLFSKVQPEVLRGWVLAMMDAAEYEMMFDIDNMDQDFMRRIREAAPELNGKHHAPFPVDVRAEIYSYYLDEVKRLSPDTPFAICTENSGVWDLIEDKVPMARDNMFCCCGAVSIPGAWETIRNSRKSA